MIRTTTLINHRVAPFFVPGRLANFAAHRFPFLHLQLTTSTANSSSSSLLDAALLGGADMLMLSEDGSSSNSESFVAAAKSTQTLARKYDVPLVIDTRTKLGADTALQLQCWAHVSGSDAKALNMREQLDQKGQRGSVVSFEINKNNYETSLPPPRHVDLLFVRPTAGAGSKRLLDDESFGIERLKHVTLNCDDVPVLAGGVVDKSEIDTIMGCGCTGVSLEYSVLEQMMMMMPTTTTKAAGDAEMHPMTATVVELKNLLRQAAENYRRLTSGKQRFIKKAALPERWSKLRKDDNIR